MKLEDLHLNTVLRGIVPDAQVTVISVQWYGSDVLDSLTDAARHGERSEGA